MLSALPTDTGMAFVIVQHLAPSHESMLSEILSRTTAMKVREIEEAMRIEKDHVYVIPPNTNLLLDDGRFQLAPYSRVRGWHMPIDGFFRSLAENYGSGAMGVVLSGVASDGVLGSRLIKAAGGVTFAQRESTAKFPEMPRAAIMAGCIDVVDSPEKIALEIARIAKLPVLPMPRDPGNTFSKILALVREKTGVDFTHYRHTTLQRRLHRRIVVRRSGSMAEYLKLLRRDKEEVEALYNDILITVTSFFRAPDSYKILKRKVFPKLLRNRRPDDVVRLWIPGCATGEEVYSLAMVLFEAIEDARNAPPVQIFATDISEKAIEEARTGIYPASIGQDVSPERLRRFFVRHENGYQISRAIRDTCVFARQNLGADPPFSNLDLISCRNLLIYLEPDLQRTILPLFHYALKPNGFLVLGAAEAIRDFSDYFEPIDKKQRIFAKVAVAPPPRVEFQGIVKRPPKTGALTVSGGPPGARLRGDSALELQHRAERMLLTRYAPVGAVVDRNFNVVSFRGATGMFLEAPQGIASFNVLKMAREGIVMPLRGLLDEAKRTNVELRRDDVPFRRPDGRLSRVDIEVVPLHDDARHLFLSFHLREGRGRPRPAPPPPAAETQSVAKMEQELSSTKEYLQSIIEEQEATNEELTSANEEIMSSNEELQSSNEELETAKEELQSSNEELRTVNDELHERNLELAAANADLTNVFASIDLPMVILDAEANIRRYTPLAEKLLKVIPSDVGRPLADLNTRINQPDLTGIVRDVVQNAQGYEREIQDRDGQWYLMRIRPYRTHDRRIDGVVIAFLDIDPVKLGVEQINRARDYAETLVETVREGLVVLDGDLRIRTANRSFSALLPPSGIRLEGRRLPEIPGWDDPVLQDALRRVVSNREPLFEFEWELREDPHTPPRTMMIVARSVKIPADPTPVALMAVQDVTARKNAEQKIRESEQRYRRIFEKAREGILLIDAASRKVVDANPFFLQMVGASHDQVVGYPLERIPALHPKGSSSAEWNFDGDRLPAEAEIPLAASSGGEIWANRVCSAYETAGLRMIQCNLRDVTAARLLRQQLWQSQKLESMGSLAGGIAHDFNNILGVLSGSIGTLRRAKEVDRARAEEVLAGMEKAIERGATFVRQLLTFARRDGEKREIVHPNAVVQELEAMLRETLPAAITLEMELGPDVPAVEGDSTQLHQALLNLAVNARDAMAGGGKIELRTGAEAGDRIRPRFPSADASRYATIQVRDSGSGMDVETRNRIFEPFFTTKASQGGSGLGLAVAYGIVQNHRGFIEVESEPGRGSTFTIRLPAAAGDGGRGPKGPPPA
ncbi:MAG TPA: CheR family methyltransferase, partial [Thermoanaerobaculia bacterium]|nr:CheR family methyltransferase [Thermoanaerobaculia bacterium]